MLDEAVGERVRPPLKIASAAAKAVCAKGFNSPGNC